MNLHQARGIFRLDTRVSMEKLNTIFRDLVKKYHPDKVRNYPKWAHERMAEINDAYALLARKMAEPVKPAPKADDAPPYPNDNEDLADISDMRMPPLSADEGQAFYPIFNKFLDGLSLYYQYGLENPSYRSEGVRRFRYREAMRALIKNRDALIECRKIYKNPVIRAVLRFARLTVADIDQGKTQLPPVPHYRKYDSRMFAARQSFDKAVKVILFPEYVPGHQRSHHYSGMYSCYSEFIIYLTVSTEEVRRKAGILQAARYDAFMTLVQLRSSGVLNF